MFGKISNSKVKAGMAIVEAHANVTSSVSHGGFNFVFEISKTQYALIKILHNRSCLRRLAKTQLELSQRFIQLQDVSLLYSI